MAVYVDEMMPTTRNKNWRYNEGCHLMADTEEELHEFAVDVLKLKRSWFQPHKNHPHYDLTFRKRRAAILNDAIEVDLEWYKEKRDERVADNHYMVCLSCSHRFTGCHEDCPHLPAKEKREGSL